VAEEVELSSTGACVEGPGLTAEMPSKPPPASLTAQPLGIRPSGPKAEKVRVPGLVGPPVLNKGGGGGGGVGEEVGKGYP